MKDFVTNLVTYLTENFLFAYQGGPIILAQIENELGGDIDAATENLVQVDHKGSFIANKHDGTSYGRLDRNATLQDYADWCGDLAQTLAPEVVWTMCNGLSANNTITTYNGLFDEMSWMENHGDSGRIQIDQPALWTEDEGNYRLHTERRLVFLQERGVVFLQYAHSRWRAEHRDHVVLLDNFPPDACVGANRQPFVHDGGRAID